MGIEPTRAVLPELKNKRFGAMANPKCDLRVNFRGMWGNVRLRRDTSMFEIPELQPFSRRSLNGQKRKLDGPDCRRKADVQARGHSAALQSRADCAASRALTNSSDPETQPSTPAFSNRSSIFSPINSYSHCCGSLPMCARSAARGDGDDPFEPADANDVTTAAPRIA